MKLLAYNKQVMALILTIIIVFVLLLASELWWRKKKPHDEFSRKFIHITVGSFVAFWPFFLSWQQIRLLGLGFIIIVAISKYFKVFTAIHAVERPTYGEICFALAVGLLTFITHSKGIYAAAILHMGLADGMAALVGTIYGKKSSYRIFGHTKSVAGSLTFLICSIIILIVYATFQVHMVPAFVILGLAFGATVMENIAVLGLDNLAVPVFLAVVLQTIA
jgi:phytol kinase